MKEEDMPNFIKFNQESLASYPIARANMHSARGGSGGGESRIGSGVKGWRYANVSET